MATDMTLVGKSALLVEAELFMADKISAHLNSLGVSDVFTAATVYEALRHIENERLDLALLNATLPNDGTTIELGWSLSSDGVAVVFYSGMYLDEVMLRARGQEFLERPLSLPRIKAAMQRAILRAPKAPGSVAAKKMTGQEARQ